MSDRERQIEQRCPACGSAARVVSSGEGTSHYEPVPATAAGGTMSDRERQVEALVAVFGRDEETSQGTTRIPKPLKLAERVLDALAAVPSEVTDELARRILEVRARIGLLNVDVDKPSALQDWPDLVWACKKLKQIAVALEAAGVQPTEEER